MKNRPLLVGLTGGIGSGKSTICKIFSALGISVYDADSRAKWLTNHDINIRKAVIESFGEDSFSSQGLNRAYIAKIVFNDSAKLGVLNGIIHPEVEKDFQGWVEKQSSIYVIKEAALMFESGSYKKLDAVINVQAPIQLRIERVRSRDTFRNRKEVVSIIDKQLTDEERNKRADHLIINDDQHMVVPQVLSLHESFAN